MEITRLDKSSIKLSGPTTAVIYTSDSTTKDPNAINFGPSISDDFSLPGEYEHDENMIIVAESRDAFQGRGNLFKCTIDEVSVLFVTSDIVSVNKQTLDFIGQVDVMFVDKEAPKNIISELIKDLEPRYVFPVDEMSTEEFSKLINQNNISESKKLKMSEKDLVEQEYVTVFSILN